jgi:hypothetical protein
MKWHEIENYKPEAFKRLTGVSKDTFAVICSEAIRLGSSSTRKIKGAKRGRKPKLSIENQLLMLLMYYREYRTFLHIAGDYGISESHCWRIITALEKTLIKRKKFHLPGKKALKEKHSFEVLLIDASESPIERPPKNKNDTIPAKRKGTR